MKAPSAEDVKQIYKETYLLYQKYGAAATNEEFEAMHKDVVRIHKEYNFKFTEDVICALMDLIDLQHRKG